VHRRVAEHVASCRDLLPLAGRGIGFALGRAAALAPLVPAAAALLGLLPLTLAWALQLRRHETSADEGERPDAHDGPIHASEDLLGGEDHIVQNQLTLVVDIKPGLLRYATLRAVLFVVDCLAHGHYVHGALGGITSIHFARWFILRDRTRARHRLVFLSSYDFSWDSYLGEFVDRASTGLTAVWSNTRGFPRACGLFWEGARDEGTFKAWARRRQIPSQVWWSGARYSTVQNVLDDVAVHRGATRALRGAELTAWLRRL
jgi:hypothetical protein